MSRPLTVTIAALREADACDLDARVEAWSAHYGRAIEEDEPLLLAEIAGVPWDPEGEEFTLPPTAEDVLWALGICWGRGGREVGVETACRAAERVLPEAGEPDHEVCLAAIAAARAAIAQGAGGDAIAAALQCGRAAASAADVAPCGAWHARRAAADAAFAAYPAWDSGDGYGYGYVLRSLLHAWACGPGADRGERAAQRADLLALLAER